MNSSRTLRRVGKSFRRLNDLSPGETGILCPLRRELSPIISLIRITNEQPPLLLQVFYRPHEISICVFDCALKNCFCEEFAYFPFAEQIKNVLFYPCQFAFFHGYTSQLS